MDSYTKGVSMHTAYIPQTEEQASDELAEHACYACGKVGNYIAGDKGKKKKVGSITYYKVGMRCVCGFVNFVYLVMNDIDRTSNPHRMSATEAIREAARRKLVSDPHLEAQLLQTKVLGFKNEETAAIQNAKACVENFPNSAPAHYNFGCLLSKIRMYEKALDHLEKAVDLDASFISAVYQKGVIFQEMEEYGRAVEHFQRFLEKYPTHQEAIRRKRICEEACRPAPE